MQTISPENSLSLPRNSRKNEMISLSYDANDHVDSQVKINLTSYEFSQHRSYTDFDINLYGYWLRLLITTKLNRL